MAKRWTMLVSSVVIGCVLFAAGYLVGKPPHETPPGMPPGQPARTEPAVDANTAAPEEGPEPAPRLAPTPSLKWKEAVNRHIKWRTQLVNELREIAEDTSRFPDKRAFAITLMGRTRSDEAIDFLLDKLELRLMVFVYDTDDSDFREQICVYTLEEMGWQVIPKAVKYAEGDRTEKQLQLLARLFKRICGTKVATVILKQRMGRYTTDPVKQQAIKNMEQIISIMPTLPRW